MTPIFMIDTKIDKDDTNYLIFPVFFPLQTSEERHERLVQYRARTGVFI